MPYRQGLLGLKKPARQLFDARVLLWVVGLTLFYLPNATHAAGTNAGLSFENRVSMTYSVGGEARSASEAVETFVDELIDVTVVSEDAVPIVVSTPASNAVLQFSVTNLGNGVEEYRLLTDDSLAGDDFDPTVTALYLETNGLVGLQMGSAGDTLYVVGSNDPELAPDESLIVYVVNTIPGGLSSDDLGRTQLRAIATTIFSATGSDLPGEPAFPTVGTAYPNLGDARDVGGGSVNAVIGVSHDLSNLLLQDDGAAEINAELLEIRKRTLSIVDPDGGPTVVPGSVLEYQIEVVPPASELTQLVVTDELPAELAYNTGSLTASYVASGQELDDDFSPAGVDQTGFDPATGTLTLFFGDLPAGSSAITINFTTTVR